jgi:hypothetical protein
MGHDGNQTDGQDRTRLLTRPPAYDPQLDYRYIEERVCLGWGLVLLRTIQ